MDSSRKQFKALTMAQPIKKQINDTLTKLQIQKRKYLSLEREQMTLKEQLQRVRRQLNEVKLLESKTRVKQNKNIQTNMSINNTDRLYLSTLNKISQTKIKIDVHRRQIEKYKKLVRGVCEEIEHIEHQNNSIEGNLLKQHEKNQTIKTSLLDYRNLNMRNTDEFKSSFNALHKSGVKQQNQRRKSQALKKNFNFQQLKTSNIIRLPQVQQQHHNISQLQHSNHRQEIYMTNCIPLVKQRIRTLIHNNKQKIKISQNYKKFGQELQNMFQIMKEYKGRDDVGFIADEFVMKEKQLKKIQQYIGKLENRLAVYQHQLKRIKNNDLELIKELNSDEMEQVKVKEKNFIKLQGQVKQSIEQLKEKEHENTMWFEKAGHILAPLVEGQVLNRGNVDKILGSIEEKYLNDEKKTISQMKQEKTSNKSPSKTMTLPIIDQKQLKVVQPMQLMSYQRLKEYAKDYISVKK